MHICRFVFVWLVHNLLFGYELIFSIVRFNCTIGNGDWIYQKQCHTPTVQQSLCYIVFLIEQSTPDVHTIIVQSTNDITYTMRNSYFASIAKEISPISLLTTGICVLFELPIDSLEHMKCHNVAMQSNLCFRFQWLWWPSYWEKRNCGESSGYSRMKRTENKETKKERTQ